MNFMDTKDITDNTPVLMTIDRFGYSIWNFYPTVEMAEADLDRANDGPETYKVSTYGEFKHLEKARNMDYYLVEISEDEFDRALNVLPPHNWKTTNGLESFTMSERWTATFTHQYARLGKRYFRRMCDLADRESFISAEECQIYCDYYPEVTV